MGNQNFVQFVLRDFHRYQIVKRLSWLQTYMGREVYRVGIIRERLRQFSPFLAYETARDNFCARTAYISQNIVDIKIRTRGDFGLLVPDQVNVPDNQPRPVRRNIGLAGNSVLSGNQNILSASDTNLATKDDQLSNSDGGQNPISDVSAEYDFLEFILEYGVRRHK